MSKQDLDWYPQGTHRARRCRCSLGREGRRDPRAHRRRKKGRGRGRLPILFGILAALLAGLGVILIVVRFFATELSYVSKGVIFIVAGLIFLGMNLWMFKRKRSSDG